MLFIQIVVSVFHYRNSSPSSSSKPVWMSLFCWTQRNIFWRTWETEQFWGTIDVPTMDVNGAPKQPGYKLSSEYIPLCSAEQRNPYGFGTTWGWVNYDRIFIFWAIYPFNLYFMSFIPRMTTLWHQTRPGFPYAGLPLNWLMRFMVTYWWWTKPRKATSGQYLKKKLRSKFLHM